MAGAIVHPLRADPDDVLSGASKADLNELIVVGRYRDGSLFVAHTHTIDASLAMLARGTSFLAERREVSAPDEDIETESLQVGNPPPRAS